MPLYNTSPTDPRAFLASPGSVTFLLGSRAPAGGTMYVTGVALASNVATVTVASFSGALPVVGTPITIRGTISQSGLYNVTNIALTGVTLDANGNGTLTFALTGSNQSTTADAGVLSFFPNITGETVSATGSTIPASPTFNQGRSINSWFFEILPDTTSALPTAATFTPQHALINQDSAYTDISGAPTATIAGSAITSTGGSFTTDAPFVRYRISGVTGSGKVALGTAF